MISEPRQGFGARSRLLLGGSGKQGQQRASEGFHLLFGLSASLGRIRCELGTQPGDLGREPVVLSRQDRDFLLGDPGSGLGLVPLLLAKLRPVAPEAGGSRTPRCHSSSCGGAYQPTSYRYHERRSTGARLEARGVGLLFEQGLE